MQQRIFNTTEDYFWLENWPQTDHCRSLSVHLVYGRLKLVLNGSSLQLEGRGDEAGVREPDLRAQLDLGRDLELLQPVVLPVGREDLEHLRHEAGVIAHVLVRVTLSLPIVRSRKAQQCCFDWHDKCNCI